MLERHDSVINTAQERSMFVFQFQSKVFCAPERSCPAMPLPTIPTYPTASMSCPYLERLSITQLCLTPSAFSR